MMRALRILALLLLCVSALRAQEPGSELRVYLMTLGPGNLVWERFGHNAIVIEDTRVGYSAAFNWGMFSFKQPGYVRRLMKGRMQYWMEGFETDAFSNYYVKDNRSIWLQELNLTPGQKVAMRDFVFWNAQEQNKFYRYDYYRDNCSTRVRDAINRALGGQLEPQLRALPSNETYRSHTERLTFDDPLTYTGLQLAMGPLIDQRLTAWEETFIPMELREWVRKVKVRDSSGREVPLVANEVTMFEANRLELPEAAPSLTIWYFLTGLLIAAGIILLGRVKRTRGRTVLLAIVVGLWCFVTGFFGVLITLLWAFTDHAVTYLNENVLQAHPLLLVLAVFAPAVILSKAWAGRIGIRLAWIVAGLSVLGFVLQILPGVDQVNGEIIALFMPIHLAVAYVLSSPRKTVTA
jgi:hypothetical protein